MKYKPIDEWILHILINSYKFVCQMCFQCTIIVHEMYELQMNKICMISIIKIWDVKFVMMVVTIGELKNVAQVRIWTYR